MANPINPGIGAPTTRATTSEPRPKAPQATESTFKVPADSPQGDTVSTRPNLSFGSLAPLVKTDLSNDAALVTAQQVEKLLQDEQHSVANNRPQVINNLYEALLKEQS